MLLCPFDLQINSNATVQMLILTDRFSLTYTTSCIMLVGNEHVAHRAGLHIPERTEMHV
jgi:hypothetical protein